jgi:hypothetical protein
MIIRKAPPSPPGRARCASIRERRYDYTDYLVHMTSDEDTLRKILRSGRINASFSPMGNKFDQVVKPTVRGPAPAVCFTEQTLWMLLTTIRTCGGRWSGYGIAYHKVAVHQNGGRPVWYVSSSDLGSEVKKGNKLWKEGCRIHEGKIPPDLQHLCVLYEPYYSDSSINQIDFSWEREWRIKPRKGHIPLYYSRRKGSSAILVRYDEEVETVQRRLEKLSRDLQKHPWANRFHKVISLETAERMLEEGDERYGRIETWPEEE